MLKAVVFDMDGTLLDSMHVWDHVGEDYLATLQIHAEEGLQEIITPMSLSQSAMYLKQTYQLEDTIEEIQQGIEAQVMKHYKEDIPLKNGVKECIERCVKENLRVCVLTASSLEMAQSAFRRCGILHHFEFIMTCEEADCPKTDVRIYQKTIEKLGIKKEECVFIDDALYAIECMRTNGYQVVAVYDEANDNDWNQICEISNQAVSALTDWKGSI
ncbi:MAG: HAD family phosphatase [Longicatena sp.]